MKVILPVVFLGNIEYYTLLNKAEEVFFDLHGHYLKQNFRNRAEMYGANGKLNLIIPVVKHPNHTALQDIKISYDHTWQKQHWKSIASSYRSSPYFEFYEHDLAPFFSKKTTSLFDFNINLIEKIMSLIEHRFTFQKVAWDPKKQIRLDVFLEAKNPLLLEQEIYTQVFEGKNGFLPNLSVLDVLFNLGPNCANYLKNAAIFI